MTQVTVKVTSTNTNVRILAPQDESGLYSNTNVRIIPPKDDEGLYSNTNVRILPPAQEGMPFKVVIKEGSAAVAIQAAVNAQLAATQAQANLVIIEDQVEEAQGILEEMKETVPELGDYKKDLLNDYLIAKL